MNRRDFLKRAAAAPIALAALPAALGPSREVVAVGSEEAFAVQNEIRSLALRAEQEKIDAVLAQIERELLGLGPDDVYVLTDDVYVLTADDAMGMDPADLAHAVECGVYDLETLPVPLAELVSFSAPPAITLSKYGRTLAFSYDRVE